MSFCGRFNNMNGDFQSFHEICPELANTETRGIFNFFNSNFPPGQYYFLESYCNDKKCDCRKVMIMVVNKNRPIATIGFGWEGINFYEKWIGDKETAKIMKGPSLELGGIHSEFANRFLKFFKEKILTDKPYIERIKTHYKIFKTRLRI